MTARGRMLVPRALLTVTLVLATTVLACAWDQSYRYPVKVRVSGTGVSEDGQGCPRVGCGKDVSPWGVAAGASRRTILCPRRGYNFELGMRAFFTNLWGTSKVVSKGGEGTFMHLHGDLRIPSEKTLWEFYAHLRLWDKVTARIAYVPWHWGGPGHVSSDGNFGGLPLQAGDGIMSDLNVMSFVAGADYDVSFGRDVIFGPNADLHVIKWSQKVSKLEGLSMDFNQTLLQPAIGAHFRYEPSNTGYFSWFKPYVEGRFSWMSFHGLGLGTWNLGGGVAPPLSRNVDAGVKLGYKQWKMDGSRYRLSLDTGIEGMYMDFSLRF